MDNFGDTDPLLKHNEGDDDDNEDEENTTTPFQPDYNSTPEPSDEEIPMMKMNKGEENG